MKWIHDSSLARDVVVVFVSVVVVLSAVLGTATATAAVGGVPAERLPGVARVTSQISGLARIIKELAHKLPLRTAHWHRMAGWLAG